MTRLEKLLIVASESELRWILSRISHACVHSKLFLRDHAVLDHLIKHVVALSCVRLLRARSQTNEAICESLKSGLGLLDSEDDEIGAARSAMRCSRVQASIQSPIVARDCCLFLLKSKHEVDVLRGWGLAHRKGIVRRPFCIQKREALGHALFVDKHCVLHCD